MNSKPLPIIITLAAAFISCSASIMQKVDFSTFVFRLLIVVVVFLVLGTIIKMVIDYAFRTFEVPSIDDELSEEEEAEDGESDSSDEENQRPQENGV